MRIAYFTDVFLPNFDGVVTSTIDFSRELARRGHQVLIFAPKPDGKLDFKEPNIEVAFLPSVPAPLYPGYRLGRGGFTKALKKVKEFHPDIFHFPGPLTIGSQGVVLAKLMEKPLVGTFHTFLTEEEYLKFLKLKRVVSPLKEFVLSFEKFYYSACDVAVTPCETLKKELLKSGFKKPIEVIPNGLDLKKIVRLSEEKILKLKEKMSFKGKVILHFGRLSGEKSIDVLLEAAGLVMKKKPQVDLLIIGDGPAFEDLQALAAKLKISDKVKFTGAIEHDKLLSSGILSVADVFVTASKMESQGLAVLEAMAAGLPVVGVRKAALPEVIGRAGLLAKPDDSKDIAKEILKILEDEEKRSQLAQASLKRAQEFSIEKSTDKLLRLYQSLLEKKRPKKHSWLSKLGFFG